MKNTVIHVELINHLSSTRKADLDRRNPVCKKSNSTHYFRKEISSRGRNTELISIPYCKVSRKIELAGS
jgi:hypothetical protein